MYNRELLRTLEDRFGTLHAYLLTFIDGKDDIYSHIASIIYNRPYEDCCEWKDDKPFPEGKYYRNKAKEFILPMVEECGGIFEPDEKEQG